MLKQLIQLQIVKKRRNFKWKNLFLGAYFLCAHSYTHSLFVCRDGRRYDKNALTI